MRKPRILVIAKTVPLHDRASGDFRLFQLLRALAKRAEVHFVATQHVMRNKEEKVNKNSIYYAVRNGNFNHQRFDFVEEKYFSDLRSIGVKPLQEPKPIPLTVRPTNDYDIRPFLANDVYDLVWVEFFYVADPYLSQIRQYQPWAEVLVDSVDLHFRRLARQAEYLETQVKYLVNAKHQKSELGEEHRQKVFEHRNYSDRVRIDELGVYEKCDRVGVVSEDDKAELLRHLPRLKTAFLPNLHRHKQMVDWQKVNPFEKRSGVVFVGNFDHNPNVTSALYLKHEVAPLLKSPVKFTLVGSNPPYIVRTMARHGTHANLFKITGYVPDTFPYLNAAKISIAPILFGAGMNGKIGEAMAAGLPVITTSLGALGMGLTHEENCLVAEGPQEFADAIDRLNSDKRLWEKLQRNARAFVESSLGSEGLEDKICEDVLGSLDLEKIRALQEKAWLKRVAPSAAFTLPSAKFVREKKPDITVILLTFNQWKVTELCLQSLAHAQKMFPSNRVEYLLVDNASSDETRRAAKKIPGLRVIENKKNYGFAKGNNIGIEAASGEDIVLLNNDTVVPPHWLDRLSLHASRIPDLGILGPSTNTETNQVLPGAYYHSVPEFFAFNREVEAKHRGQWQMVRKISGLCMYLPRRTIETVGLLDEDYGIGYFEDDDYCLRTANAGLKIVWAKDLYLHHFGSMSFERNSMKRDKHLEFGMSQFIFKWGKRGLDHIAKAHDETLLRPRSPGRFELL